MQPQRLVLGVRLDALDGEPSAVPEREELARGGVPPGCVDDEAVAFAELGLHRHPAHLDDAKRAGVRVPLVATCRALIALASRRIGPAPSSAHGLVLAALAQLWAPLASIRRRRPPVVSGFGFSAVSLNATNTRLSCGSLIAVANTHGRSGRLHGSTELPSRCIRT